MMMLNQGIASVSEELDGLIHTAYISSRHIMVLSS